MHFTLDYLLFLETELFKEDLEKSVHVKLFWFGELFK